MTSRAGAVGGLARLLLLALLLIGLGVVHTLAHADAHDGITRHTAARHLEPPAANQHSLHGSHGHEASATEDAPTRTGAAADSGPLLATADPESLPDGDCWASVPAGPGLVPPAQSQAGTTDTAYVTPPVDGPLSPRACTSPHTRGIMRI
ncbi:hypothetical protein [Streptomyces sp. NPDC057877]|uniref:hypothetical protein n=1 Tax=Streptomyces sp. NPDC057877 TaxID=3346269 RepID=UPI0036A66F29